MICISASMQTELLFLEQLSAYKTIKKQHFTYTLYRFRDTSIASCVCETGKVSAAAAAQQMIDLFNPTLFINTGTSGSLCSDVKVKHVVIAEDCIQHDYDVSLFGYKRGEHPDLKTIAYPCDQNFIRTAEKLFQKENYIHFGRILTGDCIVATKDKKEDICKAFGGLCAEMEGAATAQVCRMNKVPFALIRGISDGETDDQLEEFRNNTHSVSEITGNVLYEILKNYPL